MTTVSVVALVAVWLLLMSSDAHAPEARSGAAVTSTSLSTAVLCESEGGGEGERQAQMATRMPMPRVAPTRRLFKIQLPAGCDARGINIQ